MGIKFPKILMFRHFFFFTFKEYVVLQVIHNLIGIANTSGTIRVLECFGAAIEKAPTRERRLVTNIKSAIYLGFAAAVCSNDIV